MPIYTFQEKGTNNKFEMMITNEEREQLLEEHPNVEQVFDHFNIGDPISLHITKPDPVFQKDVLGKVRDAHPHGNVERRYAITKEI